MENTYNRTGIMLEIERENDEIFGNMMVVAMVIGIVLTLIK